MAQSRADILLGLLPYLIKNVSRLKVADNVKAPYLDVKSLNAVLNMAIKMGLTCW